MVKFDWQWLKNIAIYYEIDFIIAKLTLVNSQSISN